MQIPTTSRTRRRTAEVFMGIAPLRICVSGPFALLLVSISLYYVYLRFIEISGMYTCPRLPSTEIWWTRRFGGHGDLVDLVRNAFPDVSSDSSVCARECPAQRPTKELAKSSHSAIVSLRTGRELGSFPSYSWCVSLGMCSSGVPCGRNGAAYQRASRSGSMRDAERDRSGRRK